MKFKDIVERCPRCLNPYLEAPSPPALSRTDNETFICSTCGEREAWEQFTDKLMPQDRWGRNLTEVFG